MRYICEVHGPLMKDAVTHLKARSNSKIKEYMICKLCEYDYLMSVLPSVRVVTEEEENRIKDEEKIAKEYFKD